MLKVCDVQFDYSDACLLRDVHFTLSPGHLLHVRGANGVGKTTLLKLLAGILIPNQGVIYYQEKSIADNLPAYQQVMCYVGHKLGISQLLTVRENCHFSLSTKGKRPLPEGLFTRFALAGLVDVPCGLLSMGQQRSVALLRLWIADAVVWLLDEPFAGLDKKAVSHLMEYLNIHLARGGYVILTAHHDLPMQDRRYQEYHL